jgi:hypothetical protein
MRGKPPLFVTLTLACLKPGNSSQSVDFSRQNRDMILHARIWMKLGSIFLYFVFLSTGLAYAAAPVSSPQVLALKELVRQHQIDSVEKLLPKLSHELRSHYIFMYKSDSLQEGSPLRPRVILFTKDGKFALTFNGEPSQYGYETIETMSFIDGEDRFIFEELVLPKDLEARSQYLTKTKQLKELESLHWMHNQPTRKGPNPLTCIACHGGKDPRPNWNQGQQWPGAYGKIQNTIWNQSMPVIDPVSGQVIQDSDQDDMKNYPEFLKQAKKHPRYGNGNLIGLKDEYQGMVALAETQELTNFSVAVALLNAKRLARILTGSSQYSVFKERLLNLFGYCAVRSQPNKSKPATSLQQLLKPYRIDAETFSTHFYKGPGNVLVSPFAGRDVLVKSLSVRDPNIPAQYQPCGAKP